MKIKVVSDLHLEFSDINIKNDQQCDVLVLSGDIMVAQDLHDHIEPVTSPYQHQDFAGLGRRQAAAQRYRDFLKRCSFQFPHVVYVAGNHEFYHGKWVASIEYLREECAKYPNVHYLERDTVTIDDVTFIGATLWTDLNKGDPLTGHAVKDMMMDYKCIRHDYDGYRKIRPIETVERHRQTLGYIKNVVAERSEDKFVVCTHHSPSFKSCDPKYAHETLMNGAYHSDLSEFILDRPQIKLWTHGHTHHPFDYTIGETRIVCNPRGYEQEQGYSEDTGWNPNIVLEI